MSFEENEISEKSNGGTEQVKRQIAERLDPDLVKEFQVIASRVRTIDPSKIRIYWLHDLPEDPETNHLKNADSRARFHRLVFCGNWQYNRYVNILGIPQTDQCAVLDTPIVPFPVVDKPSNKINLIYTSTPQRGLELLVPVFEKLAETNPDIHLDVYSSFNIYGWPDADKRYEELFERCRKHPQITYHGAQPNEAVRDALQRAHIFAYPSIWQECNSRSLIEAMSARLLCVHPNLAGLSDTSGNLTAMYQYNEDANKHANLFYAILQNAINIVHAEQTQNYLSFVKAYTDTRYSIDKVTAQWKDLMTALLQQYPDAASRALPEAMFRYNT